MATFRKRVQISKPDSLTYPDLVANHITSSNEIDNILVYVLSEGASDSGVYFHVEIPKNYVGSPKLIAKGIYDAVGGTTFAFTTKGIVVADNETVDAAFGTEDTGSFTVASYSDKDKVEVSITLTNLSAPAVDDTYFGFFGVDVTANDATGNFLLYSLEFEYADA